MRGQVVNGSCEYLAIASAAGPDAGPKGVDGYKAELGGLRGACARRSWRSEGELAYLLYKESNVDASREGALRHSQADC